MSTIDPAARFSARADVYARARPSYPSDTIDLLRKHHRFAAGASVADIGAGTGIFTRLLLEAGARVWAVEPNADMRAEAERSLGDAAGFTSVAGRAEATTLPDASVDLVVAAQAFHWFDVEDARREHRRILRPDAHAALVWNDRHLEGTPFLVDYERILVTHCPGYRELQGKADTPAKFDRYFGPGRWTRHTAENAQHLDREGLVERVISSSYAPRAGTAGHRPMVAALEEAFDRHATDGRVAIAYTTVVIGGPVSDESVP